MVLVFEPIGDFGVGFEGGRGAIGAEVIGRGLVEGDGFGLGEGMGAVEIDVGDACGEFGRWNLESDREVIFFAGVQFEGFFFKSGQK